MFHDPPAPPAGPGAPDGAIRGPAQPSGPAARPPDAFAVDWQLPPADEAPGADAPAASARPVL